MPASKKLDINLLKEGGIGSKPLGRFLKWSLSYGRYIIIGTQIIVLLAFFSRFILDQQLSDLHTLIEQKINILQALAPIENNTRLLQNKVSILKTLEDSRNIYTLVTNKIAAKVPQNVAIAQLIISGNSLTLNGSAQTNAGFSELLSFLKNDPLFSQINIEDVSQEDNGTLTFKLSTIINKGI